MRRFLVIILSIALFQFDLAAQDSQNPKYFRMPANVKSGDYVPGSILVKLKPEHRDFFSRKKSVSPVIDVLREEIQLLDYKCVLNDREIEKIYAARTKKPSVDIALYHQIFLDPGMDVETAINGLYATGKIEFAEPNWVDRVDYVPNDPSIPSQFYLEKVRAFEAWDITTGNPDIIIAIIDSGIDLDHPDLAGNIYINTDEIPDNGIDDEGDGFIDNYYGWDFIGANENTPVGDPDPGIDKIELNHGTWVAGCAAAVGDNGIGIAGVAYGVKLMITKHSGDSGDGRSIINSLSGVLYAANHGADIINLSFGSNSFSQFAQDIYEFAAVDQGALCIAAAGNTGIEQLRYPASYQYVYSAAATDINDNKAQLSTFGRTVDFAAPGVSIFSTDFDDAYSSTQGTSFSAPIACGVAALAMSQHPSLSGIQIGELLRATADPAFYENLIPAFDFKMGSGRVDAFAALTEQPPSIRVDQYSLKDENGNSVQPGETAYLSADFFNYLWPSTGDLSARIVSNEPTKINIVQDFVQIGAIGTEQVKPVSSAFVIDVLTTVTEDEVIPILFEFTDGTYSDYQWVDVIFNATFIDVDDNELVTTVSSKGRLGWHGDGAEPGSGFQIKGTPNTLFEMGLMLGHDSTHVSSSVRSTGGNYDNDFVTVDNISEIEPGEFSSTEVFGSFNDEGAGTSKSEVEVGYRSMIWTDDELDQMVIVEYDITNNGGSTLNDFYLGLYADWDINQKDRAEWFEQDNVKIGYVFNTDLIEDTLQVYNGIQVLTGTPNYYAIDNNNNIAGNPFGVYDGFSDEEKFGSMSSGIARTEAGEGTNSEENQDVSQTVASGPWMIPAGETITVAFAIHGALSLDDLKTRAAHADTVYSFTLQAPTPVVDSVEVCYGDPATLTATGATDYNWYLTKTGGQPVQTGSSLTTGNLLSDTTFFVSNAENSYESVRTAAHVSLLANPNITSLGFTSFCEGESVILEADPADTYLWMPGGETTQQIVVNEAGNFTVQVTEGACTSTSDPLTIEVLPLPVPSFTFSPLEPGAGEPITFTDSSTDAVGWSWDFGDAQTSEDQNPTHQYAFASVYTVRLTVEAANGCTAFLEQDVSLITSVEDDLLLRGTRFYPNPTDEKLTISIENEEIGQIEVSIYDLQGVMISQQTFIKNSIIFETSVDVSSLRQGLYILKISNANKLVNRRFIRQ